MCDDLCDLEDEDFENKSASKDLDREWNARKQSFFNEGFRSGVDDGKNKSMEDGFYRGFDASFEAASTHGFVKGGFKALEILSSALPDLAMNMPVDADILKRIISTDDSIFEEKMIRSMSKALRVDVDSPLDMSAAAALPANVDYVIDELHAEGLHELKSLMPKHAD